MAGDLSSESLKSSVAPFGDSGDVSAIEAELVRPVLRREVVAVALWTLIADLLIFRAYGFSGPGLFFGLVPLLFFIGCDELRRGPAWKLIVALLLLVAVRLIWSGSGWTIFSGVVLVVALAMSAAGYVPYVLEGGVLAGRVIVDGARRLGMYRLPADSSDPSGIARSNAQMLSWLLPTIAVIVFGSIFVFANPNLFDWVSLRMTQLAERIQLWFEGVSYWEIPFCVLALLIGAGLMRPVLPMLRIGPTGPEDPLAAQGTRSALYTPLRNTLWTLIVLFAAYLSFEFITLWKRDFPPGFYYAGYAHQGAAWLTFALALATAVLSLAFSGAMLRDDRLGSLRRLSWIWSAQNLLLAAAVYNRLMIYVGYNGMTRMRTVGFFGTTLVVVGFCLVVYKIGQNRGFWWLIRAQLIALMLTVIAYSIFPVDYVAHRYNTAIVDTGYLHPSVMIAVKPKGDEGVLPMLSLVHCEDEIIRNGVLALLAQRQLEIEDSPQEHWTEFQGCRALLKRRLAEQESEWSEFRDAVAREHAIEAFRQYAMQWY